MEPVSVVASTWKDELLGRVTSTSPVLVSNRYDPLGSMVPSKVTEPVSVFRKDCPVSESCTASIEPVLLDNDICPVTPVTSTSPVSVLICRLLSVGTVTSIPTLLEPKKPRPLLALTV